MMIYTVLISAVVFLGILCLMVSQKNFDSHLQSFMEYNNDIVALTTETDIIYINKAGLNFFGFNDLKTLKQKSTRLNQLFTEIPMEGIRHTTGTRWIARIPKGEKLTIQIKKENLVFTFYIQVNKIRANRYLITFHDISRIVAEKKSITKTAEKDELTQVYNRTKSKMLLASALRNAAIYHTPFTVIIFDIDHFKKVNDTHGHHAGDLVLREISSLVKHLLRTHDVLARWGGEEFIIISENTTLDGGVQLAERLRKDIETYTFPIKQTLTCSFGVAAYIPKDTETSILKRADEALYRAKASGRNRVCH